MTATNPSSPMTAHSIDLINEDDAGAIALGLLEQIPYPGGPHTDKHLHKLATTYGEKGDTSLTGHRTTQQSLPRAWGAYQEHTARNPGPQSDELLRSLQKLHHLLELLLRLIYSGNIIECNSRLCAGKKTCLAPPKAKCLITSPSRPAEDEPYQPDKE